MILKYLLWYCSTKYIEERYLTVRSSVDTSACVFASLVEPSQYNVRYIADDGCLDDDNDIVAKDDEDEL